MAACRCFKLLWNISKLLAILPLISCQGSKPIIIAGPYANEFVRGKQGQLPCQVVGSPAPIVTWYRNNQPVTLGSKVILQDDNSLLFKRIHRRNVEGVYQCVARNAYGEARSANATITVIYLSKKFKRHPQSTDTGLLNLVELQCNPPGGNPPPIVAWRKNGVDIKTDRRVQIKNVFGSVHFLRISEALQQDTGNYTCVAKNKVGERVSRPAFLRILVKPAITVIQGIVRAYEQENAKLACQATGVPSPSIKWYKANDELPLSTRLRYLTPGTSRNDQQVVPSKIEIQNVQVSDAGIYTCRAMNSQGFTEENVTLIVRMLPKFLTRPGNLKVGIGQTAKFECIVQAEPGFKIIWQRTVGAHSVLLIKDQLTTRRIIVGSDGSLTIRNVEKSDQASYVCTVISGLKPASATARLTVVETVSPLPEVTIYPVNQTVKEGRNFNVTCIAKGTPTPKVSWQSASSNSRITETTEGVILKSDGFKHTLVLLGVRSSDSGSYRCTATNSARIVYKVAYLNVEPVLRLAEPPDYVDFTNVTETSLILRWKASRNPRGAPVTSYIVSVYDTTGHTWKAIAPKVKKLEYKVRNLQPGTTYEFRITAVNKVGQGQPTRATVRATTKASRGVIPTIHKVTTGTTPKPIDKLSDISFELKVSRGSKIDEYIVLWTVSPANAPSRVMGYDVQWRKRSDRKFGDPVRMNGGTRNSYILQGLEPGTPYQVKVRAFNEHGPSAFSNIKAFSTMTKQEVSIPPPRNVKVNLNGSGNVLVTWQESKISRLTGYEVVWIRNDGTEVPGTQTVPSTATSFLITGLTPNKAYHVTVALVVNFKAGLKSTKHEIIPKVVISKNGIQPGPGTNDGNGNVGTGPDAQSGNGVGARETQAKKGKESKILTLIQKPWFIGAVGGFFWVLICIIVFVIVFKRRRRRRKAPEFLTEQTNGLLPTNRTPVNSISRTRASYRDSAFLWGDPETVQGPGLSAPVYKASYTKNGTLNGEIPEKAEMRPLMSGKIPESMEMKIKPVNGDFQRLKDANNLRRLGETGSISSSNRETFVNNLKNDRSIERYAASPKLSLNRNIDNNQDKPRLKIQAAFDVQQGNAEADLTDEMKAAKNNMLDRHAEIVRTSNKKFESDLVNCMENNTQATWKREKMKEAPEILTSGEDTLRRKAKNSFKPLPKLEVLNWADYPTTPSKAGSSAGSPPSSPKTSASTFSDNNGSRATSRASQGSMTSLNKYPYGNRSGHAPSVSSRRMSQSSSMMSSELYQSEMEPSVYSDAASERKKPKSKALPPPISLDGLTSDILLQWAESVTNSSPSSSGSSSPSRLSAVSSDGSFLTDEDFAQAVAAVVECGGFMDFDYSLSNMPGLQAPPPNRPTPTDRQQKRKMEKIDAMIAAKGKSSRSAAGSGISHQRPRQDTCSPPSVTPISFSSYLSNNPKRTGGSSLSSVPLSNSKHRLRSNNPGTNVDPPGTRYGNLENDAPASYATPLTMSNLRQHDSSLGRDKKLPKPLTVSNLRQHDTSLERHKKPATEPAIETPDEVFDDGAKGLANGNVAQPLSVISALERNESLGSTKDSKSSINSEFEGRGTSERRKEKKYVVNLKDPTSSTGTSTASTVRTSQDQTEC